MKKLIKYTGMKKVQHAIYTHDYFKTMNAFNKTFKHVRRMQAANAKLLDYGLPTRPVQIGHDELAFVKPHQC